MQQIDEIKSLIASVMEEWGAEFVASRRRQLAGKVSASGQLERGIAYQIDKQARADAVQMLIAFPEHGRFIDMRKLDRAQGGEELVTAIEEWIREKGREAKMIQGFMRRHNLKQVPSDVLNRIAWGIARSPRKRRRRWYNKPKSGAITDLMNMIAERMPDEVIRQQKQLMTNL